ncbi:DUF4747 family protein [Pararhizobium sp. BT-229]|uniref:DUF4747 family protein n=1 Tax=Pararhizobium sp. BT-229 TaxID=2986923 RepID=UPI0021F6EC33|nr:DUF4747 family protein [Pararhizobium sp. BT-229]MCV9960274.1 DUF4747 family protein [Pararhizobium sp. BT-229]
MARKIKVSASSLNIRIHPHDAERYANWLHAIYRKRIIAPVYGDRHGMISMLDRSEAEDGIVTGTITTFVKFDKNGEWFNSADLKEATKDQVSEVSIPVDMHWNPGYFYFKFYTKRHRLYFQTYSKGKTFTPLSAQKFFSHLSANLDIMGEFGEAQVSIVQDKATLDKMFKIDRIKEISITILKPNPDIFDDDFDKNVEAHLAQTHSREITVTYKADANGSITPDDDINKIGTFALTNGSVTVVGRDGKGAVRMNSEQFPEELHDRFDPEVQSERNAFFSLLPALPPVAK